MYFKSHFFVETFYHDLRSSDSFSALIFISYIHIYIKVACILLPLLIPIESYFSKKARAARKSVLKYSDKRMALINEIIDGIRTVKLTGLYHLMYSKACKFRDAELVKAFEGKKIEMVNTVITKTGATLITLFTFLAYTILTPNDDLTPDRAFAAMTGSM